MYSLAIQAYTTSLSQPQNEYRVQRRGFSTSVSKCAYSTSSSNEYVHSDSILVRYQLINILTTQIQWSLMVFHSKMLAPST